MKMTRASLEAQIDRIRRSAKAFDCDFIPEDWIIGPGADPAELDDFEDQLGIKPSPGLRELFAVSKEIDFGWYLVGDLPAPFEGITCGGCQISIDGVLGAEQERKEWVDSCFSDRDDEIGRIWRDSTGLMCLSTGDLIAFDRVGRVLYLDHEGGEATGCVIAKDFGTFFRDFLSLGAPDLESICDTIIEDSRVGLDPGSSNARLWRELLLLDG